MAANNITDILVRESGRYGTDIYKRVFATSPWIHLTPRDVFPEAMGEIISVLTYERNAPDDTTDDWTSVTVVDGADGGACLQEADEVEIGSTTRTYGLKRKTLKGPKFCAEEQRSVFALREQLESITKILAGRTKLEWDKRNRAEYFRMCQYKQVCDDSADFTDTQATAYDGTQTADTILTQGFLDKWKPKLIRDGAGETAMSKHNGAPVLSLVCSAETSEHIIRDYGDNQDDLRWGQPSELLRQIGVERIYRGFHHIIDPYPRRFTLADNTYTEVAPFVRVAASKGYKYKVNPDWEAATYEESFIFDRGVYTQLIPKPVTNPHPNFKFDPISYMGDWKLLNILDEDTNPRGNIIFHHGVLASATKPISPELGVAFIHLRCDAPLRKKACADLETA
jgi:hypothetical protein